MSEGQALTPVTLSRQWLHCRRWVWFILNDIEPPPGEVNRFEELLAEVGNQHEQTVLKQYPNHIRAQSAEHTQELIAQETPVLYQPIFLNTTLGLSGIPDFLIREDDGTYRIVDAKLARDLKGHTAIELQLALYQLLFPTSKPPQVILGTGELSESKRDVGKQAQQFIEDVTYLRASKEMPAVCFGESKCRECPYDTHCRPKFIEAKDISLIYGIDSRNAQQFKQAGITNYELLANTEAESLPRISQLPTIEKKKAVIARAKSLISQQPIQLAPCHLPEGTWIHFDVEVNPLTFPQEVYLWGLLGPGYDKGAFTYAWSDGSAESDKQAWLEFLEIIDNYRSTYANIVLAHYSPYERTQIRSYAERYQMEEHPSVQWLLGEHSPLFDVLTSIRNSFAFPTFGYGLKALCKHPHIVNFQWELEESGSQWSVIRYIEYLQAPEAEKENIKAEILSYNRDDVRGTRALEEWVRGRY